MAIKVLVNGAFGRMGQMIVTALSSHPILELVGQTSKEYDLKKSIADSNADVVIDFTHPDSVYQNTLAIIETGAHPVIGTSGLNLDQITKLQEKSAKLKLGGVIAPNFSIAAVLMMKYAQAIAKYMPEVEIIEKHHGAKADSPSGTALYTAQVLKKAAPALNQLVKPGQETLKGARGANYEGIHIHSLRLTGLLAHQEILFGNLGETLSLCHNTLDRQCFLPGIFLACEKVIGLHRLIYGLEEILE